MKKLIISVVLIMYVSITYGGYPYDWTYNYMFDWVIRYTPTGEPFHAGILKDTCELTQAEKNAQIDYFEYFYPNATILGEPTRTYNCHGYTWYASEGEGNYWIQVEDTFCNASLGKPSYEEITDSNWEWEEYVKINYTDINHSAITTNHEDTIISKWDNGPLFRHHIDDDIFFSSDHEYYGLLTPDIDGCTDTVCNGRERVFTGDHDYTNFDVEFDWSVSGDLDEVSGDGTDTYTVEGNSNYGTGSVNLRLVSPSGCPSGTATTGDFHIGVPNAPYNILCVYCYQYCVGQEYIFQVEDYNDLFTTSYYWSVNYAGHITYGQGGPSVSVYMDYPYQADISVYAYNTCGSSSVTHKYVYVSNCGRGLMVYPNPAKDEITFSIDEELELSKDAVYEITDNFMNKLVAEPLKTKEKTINISGLKKGLYYISVYTSGELITEKFMKD